MPSPPDPTMHLIASSDGVGLAAADVGEGPAIAVVNGFGGSARAWQPIAERLVAAGHRVVAIDRRSHGASEHVRHGQDLARHGADVAEVLAALDLADVVAVGASMGASALWAMARDHGTDRLAGIVSVDQTPRMLPAEGWDLGFTGLTAEGLDGWIARFPDGLIPFHRVPPPELLALAAPATPFPLDDLRGLLRDHAVSDWREVIAAVDVPVLAVAGRQSPLWPWPHAEAVADLARRGRAVVIDDCGHVPALEQPEALAEAILAFAREIR
jgi:non-heme chloroperoxidase